MKTQHTPTPWMKGTYDTTDDFRSIKSHECICKPDGSLLAVFGPAGDPQSIIDRDAAGRAVNSHDVMLSALKDVEKAYQDMFDIMPVAFQTVVNIVEKAIAQAEGRP